MFIPQSFNSFCNKFSVSVEGQCIKAVETALEKKPYYFYSKSKALASIMLMNKFSEKPHKFAQGKTYKSCSRKILKHHQKEKYINVDIVKKKKLILFSKSSKTFQ